MNPFEQDSRPAWGGFLLIFAIASLVAFQQNYAKSHHFGIEQPVSYLGIAEYLFRHPEKLIGY